MTDWMDDVRRQSGVAEGKGPDTPVRDVMTPDVKYCFEDGDLEDVAQHGRHPGSASAGHDS